MAAMAAALTPSGYQRGRVGDPRLRPRLFALADEPTCLYRARIVAEMNAALDPALWRTLEGTTLREGLPHPLEDAVDALRKATGRAVDVGGRPADYSPDKPPFRPWDLDGGGPLGSVLAALASLVQRTGTKDRPFTFQFRGDRIVILPVADAVDWWRSRVMTR